MKNVYAIVAKKFVIFHIIHRRRNQSHYDIYKWELPQHGTPVARKIRPFAFKPGNSIIYIVNYPTVC